MNNNETSKRVRAFFIGAPFYVSVGHKSVNNRFEATGWNTGNLFIGDALARILDVDIVESRSVHNLNDIDSFADIIVIPAANFLAPQIDLTWLLSALEASNLPVMMLGVGAQFPVDDIRGVTLPKTTLRVMSMISERTSRIGVRGRFTADVLSYFGIKNIEITGCASILRSGERFLKVKPLPNDLSDRLIFNGSSNVTMHSEFPSLACDVERSLFVESDKYHAPYILQNEIFEMLLLDGQHTDNSLNEASAIMSAIGLKWSGDRYIKFIQRDGKVFYDVEEWSTFVSNYDLSVGTRFHGNVIALSQGICSLFIVHDSRTKELCESLKIPFFTLKQYSDYGFEKCVSMLDFSDFERNFPIHRERIAEFFDANAVPHRLGSAVFTPNPSLSHNLIKDAHDNGLNIRPTVVFNTDPIEKIKELLNQGKYFDAFNDFSVLDKNNPKFNGISQYMAVMIFEKYPEQSINACLSALQVFPNDAKTWLLLSKSYAVMGDSIRAKESASRGLIYIGTCDDELSIELRVLVNGEVN